MVMTYSFWFFMSSSILLGLYLLYLFYKSDMVREKLRASNRMIVQKRERDRNKGAQIYTLSFDPRRTTVREWAIRKTDILRGGLERLRRDVQEGRTAYVMVFGRIYSMKGIAREDDGFLYLGVKDICTSSLFPECSQKTHITGTDINLVHALGLPSHDVYWQSN